MAADLFDFEKELTCSICTDILYQPLTLLDCLHTYCGGCLKEWFAFQAAGAGASSTSSSSRRSNVVKSPYTCPSCRESVRGTKADWRLTAHLEGFLKAHPDKAKSEADQAENLAHYTPGEDVLPPLPRPNARMNRGQVEEFDESEDERLLADVRELSMASVDPDVARRRAERDRTRRHRASDAQRAQEERRAGPQDGRQVEHQPSLRSLLSGEDLQEEILESIYSEGLLEGIDVDNLTSAQEEELTERIAEAYRRRQRNRDRSRNRDRARETSETERSAATSSAGGASSGQAQSSAGTDGTRQRRSTRTESHASSPSAQTETQQNTSPATQTRLRAPIARPHVFEQTTSTDSPARSPANDSPTSGAPRRHRRSESTSLTNQRRTPPTSLRNSNTRLPPTNRSATDLSNHPSSSSSNADERRERRRATSSTPGSNARSTTDPENLSESARAARTEAATSDAEQGLRIIAPINASRARSHEPPHARGSEVRPNTIARAESMGTRGTLPLLTTVENTSTRPADNNAVGALSTTSAALRSTTSNSAFAPESITPLSPIDLSATLWSPRASLLPTVTCARCKKANIELQVHYHCDLCSSAGFHSNSYDLCRSCYRAGKGCEHWFGFGWMALDRYQRTGDTDTDRAGPPHVLFPRQYLKPVATPTGSAISALSSPWSPQIRREQPRLLDGSFCEVCFAHADKSYWYCELCLDGAWGYCNSCVLQGKCCTHPLLPVARIAVNTSVATTPKSPTQLPGKPLTIPHLLPNAYQHSPPQIECDVCRLPVSVSSPRFHCYECSGGDYDVCAPCYRAVCGGAGGGAIGPKRGGGARPPTDDGEHGWRRCPNIRAHRLAVVTNDATGRRVVVREKVGGWRLREDPRRSSLPAAVELDSAVPSPLSPQSPAPPAETSLGYRVIAAWSYFPEGVERKDELSFPRNAELTEVQDLNEDWSVGVACSRVGVFPRNHTRRL